MQTTGQKTQKTNKTENVRKYITNNLNTTQHNRVTPKPWNPKQPTPRLSTKIKKVEPKLRNPTQPTPRLNTKNTK